MTDPLSLAVMTCVADVAELEALLNGALRRQRCSLAAAERWHWAFRVAAAMCLFTCALYVAALAARVPVGYGWWTAVPILDLVAAEYAIWRSRRSAAAAVAAGAEVDRLLATLTGPPR